MSPESIKQVVTMWRTAFPDMRYTLENIIAEGVRNPGHADH
jgi:predicted ester cyclase